MPPSKRRRNKRRSVPNGPWENEATTATVASRSRRGLGEQQRGQRHRFARFARSPRAPRLTPSGREPAARSVDDVHLASTRLLRTLTGRHDRTHQLPGACRTFVSVRYQACTFVTPLILTRNEGVPGSSPGVGFLPRSRDFSIHIFRVDLLEISFCVKGSEASSRTICLVFAALSRRGGPSPTDGLEDAQWTSWPSGLEVT
jgi:hypothetical protein